MAPSERLSRKKLAKILAAMPNKREGGNSPYHSQAAWNRWQRVEIHNGGVKKPTFRCKSLLNPSGVGAGMEAISVRRSGRAGASEA